MSLSTPELVAFLSGTPFFGGVNEQTLARLAAMLVARRFGKGETVFREGDQGRSMYIVRAGELVASRRGDSGHHVRLVRFGRGDFFGDTSLIAMQARSATVVAESEAELLELTNQDLYRLYKDDVESYVLILMNVNRELCRRITKADCRLTELADDAQDDRTQIRPASSIFRGVP